MFATDLNTAVTAKVDGVTITGLVAGNQKNVEDFVEFSAKHFGFGVESVSGGVATLSGTGDAATVATYTTDFTANNGVVGSLTFSLVPVAYTTTPVVREGAIAGPDGADADTLPDYYTASETAPVAMNTWTVTIKLDTDGDDDASDEANLLKLTKLVKA